MAVANMTPSASHVVILNLGQALALSSIRDNLWRQGPRECSDSVGGRIFLGPNNFTTTSPTIVSKETNWGIIKSLVSSLLLSIYQLASVVKPLPTLPGFAFQSVSSKRQKGDCCNPSL
jgi:hypothetical protein